MAKSGSGTLSGRITADWQRNTQSSGNSRMNFGAPSPASPYSTGGTWGAFELAARYGELEIDKDAFPIFANAATAAEKAKSYGLGVNWYLTSNVKAVINSTNTNFDGGAAGGEDREVEKTVFARLQLAF